MKSLWGGVGGGRGGGGQGVVRFLRPLLFFGLVWSGLVWFGLVWFSLFSNGWMDGYGVRDGKGGERGGRDGDVVCRMKEER